MTVMDRLISKIVLDENDCWLWTGGTYGPGYGKITVESNRARSCHLLTYEHFRGSVPQGQELDHLCRVRRCANPWHLEAVTHRENTLRGVAPHILLHNAARCKRGHSLIEHGEPHGPSGTRRRCRLCRNARRRRIYAERKSLAATEGKGF